MVPQRRSESIVAGIVNAKLRVGAVIFIIRPVYKDMGSKRRHKSADAQRSYERYHINRNSRSWEAGRIGEFGWDSQDMGSWISKGDTED